MTDFLRGNLRYVLAALVLHVAIGIALTVTIRSAPQTVVPQQSAIKGVVIDNLAARLKRERAEKERLAQAEKLKEEQAKEQAQVDAAQAERLENERKEVERKALESKETERKEIDRKQQLAVQQKQRQAEAEKTAVRQQQELADKKRLAEIKEKQTEKLRSEQAAREQAQRENELRRQMAEEEGRMQVQNSGLRNQYAALIEQRVVRNWNKPPSAKAGIECTVTVTQAPGGTVLSVQIDRCNGDSAVKQSIEAAVYRASPLPAPPDARLFERVIVFVFKPIE